MWYGPDHFGVERASIQQQLQKAPGRHLVLVRYSPDHYALNEWVYNSPNLDNSKIIWAREMDAATNQELIRHYPGRRVWLVQPDLPGESHLQPYPYAEPGRFPDPPAELAGVQLQSH
jgi:hypothetical protein